MARSTDTYFASAGRRDILEVAAIRQQLRSIPNLLPLLEAFPTPAVVLNTDRQIVLHNRRFAEVMPDSEYDRMLALRIGEAVGCVNAAEAPSGCGTGEPCRMCGAVIAMLEAQKGRRSVEECRITIREDDGVRALDYRVYAMPVELEQQEYTILSLTDISDAKRRRILERIFFHDILNTAGGLRSLAEIFRTVPQEQQAEMLGDLEALTNQLIGEIEAQRDLLAAENGELPVESHVTSTADLLDHVISLYRFHTLTQERELRSVNLAPEEVVVTDARLLSRALSNLVKNALEASAPGDVVTLTCRKDEFDLLHFAVHNPGTMAEAARLQVFQRSFSTKGPGRGVGTYSVRLIVERFLGGTVRFSTGEEDGTRFEVTLPANGAQSSPDTPPDSSQHDTPETE